MDKAASWMQPTRYLVINMVMVGDIQCDFPTPNEPIKRYLKKYTALAL